MTFTVYLSAFLEGVAVEEQVVLVDVQGNPIGTKGKLQAHQDGDLHLALSVFLFNSEKKFLMQRRALCKYHSPNLWSNTCCSHPRPGESVQSAAERRLFEEMGIVCPLTQSFTYTYREEVGSGLIEHEFDCIFFGSFEGNPCPNSDEVSDWKWISYEEMQKEIAAAPHFYTAWFKLLLDPVFAAL